MRDGSNTYLSQLNMLNVIRSHARQLVTILSLFVILGVFWSLKLTGITMAGEAFCGREEHAHGEGCITTQLVCQLEEVEPHTHEELCLRKELICGLEEIPTHIHTDDCLPRILTCVLEEFPGHTHGEECYALQLKEDAEKSGGHIHDDGCKSHFAVCTLEEGEVHRHTAECHEMVLLCAEKEHVGHTHGDGCYDTAQTVLNCGQEEHSGHIHDESCYERELMCRMEEEPAHNHGGNCFVQELSCQENGEDHVHGAECYTAVLVCTKAETEGHSHCEDCYNRYLVCSKLEDTGHIHDDSCQQPVLICTTAEDPGHTHGKNCFAEQLCCDIPEQVPHTHDEDCQQPVLVCELEESDGEYGEDCYERILICTQEEVEGHTHEENCYTITIGEYVCGLEETAGHAHDAQCWQICAGFGCGLTEAEGHIHTDECVTEETLLDCGLEATPGHIHTEEECCVILQECLLEEHIHDATCYSDLSADLEDRADWEWELPEFDKSTPPAQRVIEVAMSQLGNMESQRNFQVDENGVRRGITRYGQWYGNPYGDWSAMFAAFCLHYAGEDDLPVNSGPEAMRYLWEQDDLYGEAAYFEPQTGHLMFLDMDGNEMADGVAIIGLVDEDLIYVIQGDLDGIVEETVYEVGAEEIMGYGRISDKPEVEFRVSEGATLIAQTEPYSPELFAGGEQLVVYVEDTFGYYALDGNGDYMAVEIDGEGGVFTELEEPERLFWEVVATDEEGGYEIRNVMTGMYLPEEGAIPVGGTFAAGDSSDGGNYQYARAVNYTVWIDGTNGGLMAYGGSPNTKYTVTGGSVFTLPQTWQSPAKYSYVVQGWYDVVNNKYYAPGEQVTINGSTVFYADWVARTYDIGRYNAQVSDTMENDEFVTTHVFDYSILFNVLSSRASVTIENNSHTEKWRLIASGTNPYNKEETLGFVFRGWDEGNKDITYPENYGDQNWPTDSGTVYPGLYNDRLGELLFGIDNAFDPATKTGVIGKTYLGEGDHLFQLMMDPNDEHYGYYYYDSERHAASYSQRDQRFYVYDYLARASDSNNQDADNGKYSDFLPMNSPYENLNGKTVGTYTYAGVDGEFNGVTHYQYDSGYDGSGNSTSRVGANLWFGFSSDIQFYLPNVPGSQGGEVNKDLYGNDMHFHFSGDDDVWVLIDGKLVLDLGGVHGIESGDINFSTGIVTVNGKQNETLSRTLRSIGAGDHTLTIMYLERGSSMSNCAIYFNLAPRFSFSIQKEDVLTRDVLNGAVFSVYTDKACTVPAQLWESKASHDRGDSATHEFEVVKGEATMWGMGAGNTYYIKETSPPADRNQDYPYVNGIICVTIDKTGNASYSVELLEENGGISGGFTVHGFRIDEETQTAYIIATNAPEWVQSTTQVTAFKQWNDDEDHTGESVTVYLTVTDQKGTVTRLQEGILSSENGWKFTWENLPKYWETNGVEDPNKPISYGVEEAYVSGYYSKSEAKQTITTTKTEWTVSNRLENGQTYILANSSGQYLATRNNDSDTGFQWVSEEFAKTLPLAQWTVTTSGNKVKLTNAAGQTLTFYDTGSYVSDFFAHSGSSVPSSHQQFFVPEFSGDSFRLYHQRNNNNTKYYLISSMTDNGQQKFKYSTNQNDGMRLTARKQTVTEQTVTVDGIGYLITNTPLEKETSLTVHKVWDYGDAQPTGEHERAKVTVELMANGASTGRTVTLSLKNGWKDTFRGLPYTDDEGKLIYYSVEEGWQDENWVANYGVVTTQQGDPPTYSTTVTNMYRWSGGTILPATGYYGRELYQLCGGGIMLLSLAYGIGLWSKRERRRN